MESTKYDVIVTEGNDWFCFLKRPDATWTEWCRKRQAEVE